MKYFKIEEFRCKDGSVTPEEAKVNLTALVDMVLDPTRERYGARIHVNSGYRTEAYNQKIGGARGSQHCCKNGSAAADICCEDNRRLAKIIVEQGRFDQLIIYPSFVHVSYKMNGPNRGQILRKTATGYLKVAPSDI